MGMIPLNHDEPGFGRTGFSRDEIDGDGGWDYWIAFVLPLPVFQQKSMCGSVDPPKDSWLESPGYFLGTQEQWYESEPHNSQERHPTWYQKMG
jgi:hypothetical protein